jgi:hypothetical protein
VQNFSREGQFKKLRWISARVHSLQCALPGVGEQWIED